MRGCEPKFIENISNVMPVLCWLYISLPVSNTNKKKSVKPWVRTSAEERESGKSQHFIDDGVMLNLFSFQDPRYETLVVHPPGTSQDPT